MEIRDSFRYTLGGKAHQGMGWGLFSVSKNSLRIEQFTHATRGRLRVATWTATIVGNTLVKESFQDTSSFGTNSIGCSNPLLFRPSNWKPDPDVFFERDKQFIKSQEYFIRKKVRKGN